MKSKNQKSVSTPIHHEAQDAAAAADLYGAYDAGAVLHPAQNAGKVVGALGAVQGDVPVIRVAEVPKDAKPTKNRIVAYGETTGHNHQVQGIREAFENPSGFYFVVAPDESGQLVHTSGGEHGTIEMKPGIYFIPRITQVEYDGEMERRVAD